MHFDTLSAFIVLAYFAAFVGFIGALATAIGGYFDGQINKPLLAVFLAIFVVSIFFLGGVLN